MQRLDFLLLDRTHDARHPTARQLDQVGSDSQALAKALPDHTPDSGMDAHSNSDSVVARVDTHWTRILYCDVFTAPTDVTVPDLSELSEGVRQSSTTDFRTCPALGKDTEISVATKDSSRNAGCNGIGSPTQVAVVLFAIAIAMCLAVVNVLIATEAVAVAPDRSMPSLAIAAANLPVSARKSPPTDSAVHVIGTDGKFARMRAECGQI